MIFIFCEKVRHTQNKNARKELQTFAEGDKYLLFRQPLSGSSTADRVLKFEI